jgi:copper chaperone NosL
MRRLLGIFGLLMVLALSACGDDDKPAPPPPKELSGTETGHYCGMVVREHPGPKGQILLKSQSEPIWFSSARDAIAFTLLPEEPRDVLAVYVNDMGKANWDAPEPGTWIEARGAWFVIGSRRHSGMDTMEAVPFGDRAKAAQFAEEYGGRMVAWADIPSTYILAEGTAGEAGASHGQSEASEAGHRAGHEQGEVE